MRIIACLFAFVFAAAAPAFAEEWIVYQPPGVGYRVELPANPTIQTRDVPTAAGPVKNTMAVVDRTSYAFIISHNDYPQAVVSAAPPEKLLDGVRDGQTQNRTLKSETPVKLGKYDARQLIIEDAAGRVFVSRFTLVGTRLFQAIYVGSKGSETSPDATRFINSFTIVD